jgi:hypothetical protein
MPRGGETDIHIAQACIIADPQNAQIPVLHDGVELSRPPTVKPQMPGLFKING